MKAKRVLLVFVIVVALTTGMVAGASGATSFSNTSNLKSSNTNPSALAHFIRVNKGAVNNTSLSVNPLSYTGHSVTATLNGDGNVTTFYVLAGNLSVYGTHLNITKSTFKLYVDGQQHNWSMVKENGITYARFTINTTGNDQTIRVVDVAREETNTGPQSFNKSEFEKEFQSYNQTHEQDSHHVKIEHESSVGKNASQGILPVNASEVAKSIRTNGSANLNVTVNGSVDDAQFQVSSTNHSGRTFYIKQSTILSLNPSAQANMSNVVMLFDGQNHTYTTSQMGGQSWVVFNVPHFTTHTIDFKAVSAGGSTSTGSKNILIEIGAGFVAIAGVAVVLYMILKDRGRKPKNHPYNF